MGKTEGALQKSESNRLNVRIYILLLALAVGATENVTTARADWENLKSLIGPRDALLVADPAGRIITSKNENQELVPASILKIFTSLGALHYLGSEYRYITEFYMDHKSNLKIKGYGDPLLISEVVDTISGRLAALISSETAINDIVVDGSYFSQPLTIPGISSSSQPYDAPNGALCVNFNTVSFKRTQAGYVSAEAQTPLLPEVKRKINQLRPQSGRIVLSHVDHENTLYAGKLFRYFLKEHGIPLRGTVRLGRVMLAADKLIYRYASRYNLRQIVAKLLEYSNNFTTNQLLISCGIQKQGPPGDLEKGVAALNEYARVDLQIKDLKIVEGSGISRKNKITATDMLRVLAKFESHYKLMRCEGRQYYKTGTLKGISTRAGYLANRNGGLYRFVVMLNTPGKSTRPIMRELLRNLE